MTNPNPSQTWHSHLVEQQGLADLAKQGKDK